MVTRCRWVWAHAARHCLIGGGLSGRSAVDQRGMQQRVCGAYAAVSVESMILCPAVFKDAWPLRRRTSEVELKEWSRRAAETLPQPCRLCKNTEFISREDWLRHVNEEHGGLQRYRNAMLCLLSTKPYAVTGQEWRAAVATYSESVSYTHLTLPTKA